MERHIGRLGDEVAADAADQLHVLGDGGLQADAHQLQARLGIDLTVVRRGIVRKQRQRDGLAHLQLPRRVNIAQGCDRRMGLVHLDAGVGQQGHERVALLDLDDLLDRVGRFGRLGRRRGRVAVDLGRRQQEVALGKLLIDVAGGRDLDGYRQRPVRGIEEGSGGAEGGGEPEKGKGEGRSDGIARETPFGDGYARILLQLASPLLS